MVPKSCESVNESGRNGTIPVEELKMWGLFDGVRLVTPMLKDLRLFYIFGETGIIVTTSDDVYLFGELFRKLEHLCGKGVKEFVSGVETNCHALTGDGVVYSWGINNTKHQMGLGIGFKDGSVEPRRLKGSLEGKFVTQLVASESHAIALTEDGGVHGWGDNRNGQLMTFPWGSGAFQASPHLLQVSPATGDKIMSAAVTKNYSFLLTAAGDVIRFGAMEQQGEGSDTVTPRRVRFNNTKFMKIVSSYNKIFALSVGKNLYKIDKEKASLIFPEDGNAFNKVMDFAGDPKVDLCVFKTMDNLIYVWGDVGGRITQRPYHATSCTDMDEAFANFWGQTYRSMTAKDRVNEEPQEVETIGWNDARNPIKGDVEFTVDGRRIQAHKYILMKGSEHFKNHFANLENADNGGPINVLSTLAAFCGRLHFIYFGKLMYSAKEHEKLCDLMQSAEKFGEMNPRKKCEEALIQGLAKENATHWTHLGSAGLNVKERLFVAIAWIPKTTVQAAIGPIALDTARSSINSDPEQEELGLKVLTIAVMVILITAPIGAIAVTLLGPKLLSCDQLKKRSDDTKTDVEFSNAKIADSLIPLTNGQEVSAIPEELV